MKPGQPEHLPVRSRHVEDGYRAHGRSHSVHCARVGRAVSLGHCAACNDCIEMPVDPDARGAEVRCSARAIRGDARPRHPSLDLREAMLRTTVGELVWGTVACVGPEMALDTAARLLSRPGMRALLAVARDAKVAGVLSEADLARSLRIAPVGSTGGAVALRTVADAMTPVEYSLPEGAPLSQVVGIMAAADVSRLPVLRADGQVIGMFTATDALRWVAEVIGYVL